MAKKEGRKSTDLTGVVRILVSLIEEKDNFLKGHSERVANLCVSFGRKLRLSEKNLENIHIAGLLHDLGMIHLPSEIIQKTGGLTEEERTLVRQHPVAAERILSKDSRLLDVLPIIRQHHESFDGSGYPDGIRGDGIHLGARILKLADTFDALISARPHRAGMSVILALGEIRANSGKAFDPELLDEFYTFVKSVSGLTTGSGEDETKDRLREKMTDIVREFKEGKIDLPHLPRIVHEIQKVAYNPESTVDDLAKVIERDGVISLKLISLANSSWNRRLEEIYSVRRAIPLLGFRETQGIIMTIAYRDLYDVDGVEYKVIMENLWLHSLASAFAAKILAGRLDFKETEKYFLLGLIHDVGKVPLLKAMSETAREESFNLADVLAIIREVYPIIGEETLKRWNLSEDFGRIAKLQALPHLDPSIESPVLIIHLASRMACYIGYCDGIDHVDLDLRNTESAKLLKLTPETLKEIGAELEQSVRHAAHFF